MKIAFVKQKYVPCGGGEAYLSGLMHTCSRKGHEVHLIAIEWEGKQLESSIIFHPVQMKKASRRTRARSFSASVKHCVDQHDFDCVISLERTASQQVWRAGDCVYRMWLKRRALFEPWYKNVFNRFSFGQKTVLRMEELCVHSTPHLIANSNLIKSDLLEIYPDLKSEIHVIHNGYDADVFSLAGREANRLQVRTDLKMEGSIICFIASGWRRKGLMELLEAMQQIPDASLVVAGRDRPDKWKKIAASFGVANRVRFLGVVKDVKALYHAADLTALPSWYDSFGFIGLESMACGTPYVATRWAGSHEIIKEGINGYVVSRPDAIDELSSAIRRALILPAGKAVASTVTHLTLEENVSKTVSVIEKALV